MCSEPVTLGGGLTIVHGSASGRSGRNRPFGFPMRIPARLDRAGLEGLGKLAHGERRLAALRRSINLGLERPAGNPRDFALHMLVDDLAADARRAIA